MLYFIQRQLLQDLIGSIIMIITTMVESGLVGIKISGMSPFFKHLIKHLTCKVMRSDSSCFCIISIIYAANTIGERRNLWSDLRYFEENLLADSDHWCIMGDLNTFIDATEFNFRLVLSKYYHPSQLVHPRKLMI